MSLTSTPRLRPAALALAAAHVCNRGARDSERVERAGRGAAPVAGAAPVDGRDGTQRRGQTQVVFSLRLTSFCLIIIGNGYG
jgi:hypothetical protein